MRKLIVNADGLGFTPGVNKGILESIANGIVTSVSCNTNFPYIEDAKSIYEAHPHVSFGVHFNLSVGKPVAPASKIRSLLNENGEFLANKLVSRMLSGKLKTSEMILELESQAKVLLDMGIPISHFDGHQNKHLFPQYFHAASIAASKHNIERIRSHRRYIFVQDFEKRKSTLFKYYLKNPKRIATHAFGRVMTSFAESKGFRAADRLITPAYADSSKKYFEDTWHKIIKTLPPGVSEIYCHPGYPDDILRKYAKYVDEREKEIEIMTSPKLKALIQKENIELISFNDI